MWPLGKLAQLLHVSHTSAFARCLLAVPGILAGTGLAALCYRLAGPGRARGFAGAAARASPALLYVTGVWKQMDMVYLFFSGGLLCRAGKAAYPCGGPLLGARRWPLKPQALILGPVLAVCVLAHAWFHPRRHAALFPGRRRQGARPCARTYCGLPFFGFSGLLAGLWEKYFPPRKATPASLSAANWFFPAGR